MSAYVSPNHNRLLDLEHHLQHQQPVPRQAPPSARRSQKQQTSKVFSTQPAAHVSERVSMPPSPTMTTHGPPGSYRQLAAQMGQHYYPHKSVALKPRQQRVKNDLAQQTRAKEHLAKNELPDVPTPISLDVVEAFEATLVSQSSPKTSPQPSWSGLAHSIQNARLGLTDPALEVNPSDLAFKTEPQPAATDWALDEIFTDENNPPEATTSTEPALAPPVTLDVIPVWQPAEGVAVKRPSPVRATQSNTEPKRLKNGLLLLIYQLACPPQIVDYLAQLSNQKQYRKKRPKKDRQKRAAVPAAD
ncbi:MAG: hypothetical protein AAFV90_23180 [Cyanobacteria bacterium J06634_5]